MAGVVSCLTALVTGEDVKLRSIHRHDRDAPLPMAVYLVAFGLGAAVVWKWWCGGTCNAKAVHARNILSDADYKALREGRVTVGEVKAKYSGADGLEGVRNAGVAEEEVEKARATKYDSTNEEHEKLLERLWAALKPGVTRKGRKTEEWEEIGFQGKDPATDFRGNGLLGLLNLVYFSENHPEAARKMVSEGGWKPTQTEVWYLFAVTGINLTSHVTKLLKSTAIDGQFAALPIAIPSDPFFTPSIIVHSQLYSSLMMSYHELWAKHKPTVMEFNQFVEKHVLPANTADTLKRA